MIKHKANGKLENTKSDINKKISELQSAAAKNEKYKKQNGKLNVAQGVLLEIERIYNQYEKVELVKINQSLKSKFDTLIRKNEVFLDVRVDDEYNLFVKRVMTDYNALNQMSYGERQMLSLALILALAQVAGDQAPFVMDTPMGNLDSIHRQNLLESIPQIIDQLFLLVTSLEFTDDLYEICKQEIAVEYRLHYSENGTTQIIKL